MTKYILQNQHGFYMQSGLKFNTLNIDCAYHFDKFTLACDSAYYQSKYRREVVKVLKVEYVVSTAVEVFNE